MRNAALLVVGIVGCAIYLNSPDTWPLYALGLFSAFAVGVSLRRIWNARRAA